MKEDYRRHDISDRAWSLLEPHLPGRRGAWGRVAQDNRKFIMQQAQEAAIKIWIEQKGAKHENPPCSRFIGNASSSYYYRRKCSRLFNCW